MRLDPEDLKAQLNALVKDPSLQPKDDTTYCNLGVCRIAKSYGLDLEGKLANQIIDILGASSSWLSVSGPQASDWAQRGGLSIACQKEAVHGHVAVLYPAAMQESASLNRLVPMVANVGKKNGIMRVSEAFPVAMGEPDYFQFVGPTGE